LPLEVYFVVIWHIFPVFGILYQEKSDNPACAAFLLLTGFAVSTPDLLNMNSLPKRTTPEYQSPLTGSPESVNVVGTNQLSFQRTKISTQ
jgi:hypothetical protein